MNIWLTLALLIALPNASLADPATLAETGEIEARFSPNEDTLNLIINTINSAKSEILVAAYSFTSKPISLALLNAHRNGVVVKVVADDGSNRASYTATQYLANNGIAVRLNDRYPIHHNKFIVVDRFTVETGSFNYSAAAADKNAENVIVVRANRALANQYAEEWERLWSESVDLPKKN